MYDRCFVTLWAAVSKGADADPFSELDDPEGDASKPRSTDDAPPDAPDGSAASASEPGRDDDSESEAEAVETGMRWSRIERLAERSFAEWSAEELADSRRWMADLRLQGPLRRSRRRRPTRRDRGHPDLRRTVRRTLRTGGEPIDRAFSRPSLRPRRVVLLCDVSGSMEPYARALLRFLHAAVARSSRVEAFTIGTRLTRLTRELSTRDPDVALAAASRSTLDWSGGTRLGEGLRTFNDEWGIRGMARGAVVVILSDGLDQGEPERIATEMARLARVAHRVIWVNPLKATAAYEPLARGMAAALPYADEFVSGHSLAALEELVTAIAR